MSIYEDLPVYKEKVCCTLFKNQIKFEGDLMGVSYLSIEKWLKNEKFEFVHVAKKLYKRVGYVHFNNEEEGNDFYDQVNEKMIKISIPGGYQKEIKFGKIQPQDDEIQENNENEFNKINYAIIEETDDFKIILTTPGLEKRSLKLFNLGRNIKIEGEFPSINGACIINNLPVGKFSIKLTLPEKFDSHGVKVVIQDGLTNITLKRLKSLNDFNELNFSF